MPQAYLPPYMAARPPQRARRRPTPTLRTVEQANPIIVLATHRFWRAGRMVASFEALGRSATPLPLWGGRRVTDSASIRPKLAMASPGV